jgi:hypothetical protein
MPTSSKPTSEPMEKNSVGQECLKQVAGQAIMGGPALVGLMLLGPVGIFLGLASSLAIIAAGSNSSDPEPPKSNN